MQLLPDNAASKDATSVLRSITTQRGFYFRSKLGGKQTSFLAN